MWPNRKVLIGLLVVTVAVSLALYWTWSLKRQSAENETARNQFVHEFVASVLDDTAFFKRYVGTSDTSDIVLSRARMTRTYRVLAVEPPILFGSDYQYIVRFSNGNWGYIDVSTDGKTIIGAQLQTSDGPAANTPSH